MAVTGKPMSKLPADVAVDDVLPSRCDSNMGAMAQQVEPFVATGQISSFPRRFEGLQNVGTKTHIVCLIHPPCARRVLATEQQGKLS
jgi:hypothetical protein